MSSHLRHRCREGPLSLPPETEHARRLTSLVQFPVPRSKPARRTASIDCDAQGQAGSASTPWPGGHQAGQCWRDQRLCRSRCHSEVIHADESASPTNHVRSAAAAANCIPCSSASTWALTRGRHVCVVSVVNFSPSWTPFQAERGRDFSVIVDDGGGVQVNF